MTNINKIGRHTYTLGKAQALVTFQAAEHDDIATATQHNGMTYMSWGKHNDLPVRREELIEHNNIIPQLLKTKRNVVLGGGIYTYTERNQDGKRIREEVETPSEIADFLEMLELEDYLLDAARDLMIHANTFTVFTPKRGGGMSSMKSIKAVYARAEEMDKSGTINQYFICGDWKKRYENELKAIKNCTNLLRPPARSQFVVHCKDGFLGNEYYAMPTYWGGSEWIEVSNAIPTFHKWNLKNGYVLRYHVQIPKGYFYDTAAVQQQRLTQEEADESAETAKQEFLKSLDDILSGEKNAGKALWSEYDLNQRLQTEFGGVKITPIQVDLKDSALLELYDKTNQANISGTGVHPSLSSIITDGGLSSGSEIRNALLMFIITQALLPRQLLLKPIKLWHKWNGWSEKYQGIKYAFRDVEITTLDNNPTASQGVNIS